MLWINGFLPPWNAGRSEGQVLVRVGDDGVLLGPIDGRSLIYAAYHDASVSGTTSNAGLAPFMIRKDW
jgi:hypothetical protein